MCDYDEEQRSEIDCLQSIYPDEFSVSCSEPRYCFAVSVKTPEYEDGCSEEDGAYCLLSFKYVDKYPEEIPEISIEDAVNLDDIDIEKLTDYLVALAEENVGMVMIFTLVSAAQEWMTSNSDNVKQTKIDEEQRKIREKEEVERKKFEGTLVTVESFLNWKIAFDAEMVTLRKTRREDSQNKKLTGRELFERDQTLNDSDIQFLQDGGEDVTVDESLFQEIDDLELDDLQEDDS